MEKDKALDTKDYNIYSTKKIPNRNDPATLIHTWNLKTSKLK